MNSSYHRTPVIYRASLVAPLVVSAAQGVVALLNGSAVNQHALQVEEFKRSVAEYVELQKSAAARLGPLKPTDSPEKIVQHQRGQKESKPAGPTRSKATTSRPASPASSAGSSVMEAGFDIDRAFMIVEISQSDFYFEAVSRSGKTVDSGILRARSALGIDNGQSPRDFGGSSEGK